MYESFFHLRERPFAASPRIDRYYPGAAAEAVRLAAARCIERAEGYVVVLGASGTGKTLLCQVLAEQFRNKLTPVLLSGGDLSSRKALLQGILFELKLPFKRLDEGEMRLALLDRIAPGRDQSEGLLLVVDEAQTLPARLFEELRLLSNVARQGKSRVRLVFAGTPALEERLAHPKLTSFQQRIAVRSTLHPFSAAESQEYVRAQTAVVGGDPDAIWGDDALAAIYQVTDGVPRLINQVCDYALLLAATGGVTQIHAQGVDEAWADLQQLPFPTLQQVARQENSQAGAGESETVIEFGSLDDEVDPTDCAPNDQIADADRALNINGGSEVELDFGDLPEPNQDSAEFAERELIEPEIEAQAVDGAEVEVEAVYDDYPIIARPKSTQVPSEEPDEPEWYGASRRHDQDVAGDAAGEWEIVPIMQGPVLKTPREPDAEDAVFPDPPGAPKVVPMRGFAAGPFDTAPIVDEVEEGHDFARSGSSSEVGFDGHDDIVHDEDVPLSSYSGGTTSDWPGAVMATAPRQKQPKQAKPQPRSKRERTFSQLFTQMRQQ